MGPQERRSRAEIPDLIAINSNGELPQSGETDFPGNPEAREIPRGLGCRSRLPGELPGESPAEFPGKLAAAPSLPGNRASGKFPGHFHGQLPGEFGRGGRISRFPPNLVLTKYGVVRCAAMYINKQKQVYGDRVAQIENVMGRMQIQLFVIRLGIAARCCGAVMGSVFAPTAAVGEDAPEVTHYQHYPTDYSSMGCEAFICPRNHR